MDDIDFLPDGRSFVFCGTEGIETMRTDGTGRRVLVPVSHGAEGNTEPMLPGLSPNGRTMAYFLMGSAGVKELREGSHLLDLSTNSDRYLGGSSFGTPCWSPDGRHIAITGTDRSKVAQLVIVDVESGQRKILTKGTKAARGLLPLSWSPAGDEILALTYTLPLSFTATNDLVVVDVPSGEEHALATAVWGAAWIRATTKGS